MSSPYQKLFETPHNYSKLRVFGCCVIHGFDCTRCRNLLLDPPLCLSRLLKVLTFALTLPLVRLITLVMFVLFSQYFLILLLILLSLGLMSPLFPHGFRSLSSTQPRLQHPRLRILHPTMSIRFSLPPYHSRLTSCSSTQAPKPPSP